MAVVVAATLLLALLPALSWAAPAGPADAVKVATTKVTAENSVLDTLEVAGLESDYSVSETHELSDPATGRLLAYVLDLDPKGYVIVSPDTDITPVIAYSFRSNFVLEDSALNIPLHMVTWDMRNRLDAIPLLSRRVRHVNNQRWAKFKAGDLGLIRELTTAQSWPSREKAQYGGWLDTQWHQGHPYNMLCPVDPATGTNSVVGCVATAMAQIVNYWEFPTEVTFTSMDDYYMWTIGEMLDATTASFSGLDYNGNPPHPTDFDMARLCYACGVSVQMDYSAYGSGAYTPDVAWALVDKFSYDSADYVLSSVPDFYSVLEENMKSGLPAELRVGQGQPGGHAIVCDGYQDTGEFHLNFGWGGAGGSDGWFLLPAGMPAGYDTIGGGVVDIVAPVSRPVVIIETSFDKSAYQPDESVLLTVTTRDSVTGALLDVDDLDYDVTNGPSGSLGDPAVTVMDTGTYRIALGGYTEPGIHTLAVHATSSGLLPGSAVPRFVVGIGVTSPTAGDVLEHGAQHNITWTTVWGWSPNVTLSVSTDGGNTWTDIVSGLANTGSYLWTVPECISQMCRVRVSPDTVAAAAGTSDGLFSIVGPSDVLKLRVKGVRWTADGGTVMITYEANNPVKRYYTRLIPVQASYQSTAATTATVPGLGDGYYLFVVTAKDPQGAFASSPCRMWLQNKLTESGFQVRVAGWSTTGPNLTVNMAATHPVTQYYARLYGVQTTYTPSGHTVTYTGLRDGTYYFIFTARSALTHGFPALPARQFMYVNTRGFTSP